MSAAAPATVTSMSPSGTSITLLARPTDDTITISLTGKGSPRGARAPQIVPGGVNYTSRTAEVCQVVAATVATRQELEGWAHFLPKRRAAGETTYLYVRGTSVTDHGAVRAPFVIKMLPAAAAALVAAKEWLGLDPAALEEATRRISGATPGGLVLLAKFNYGRPPAAGAHKAHTAVVEMVAE